jgi:SAM-dependent methyltransferase
MPDSIVYNCGCTNQLEEKWGVLHCIFKCQKHRDEAASLPTGLDYCRRLGLIDSDGNRKPSRHAAELIEAIGWPFNDGFGKRALEIGCAISNYADLIRGAGFVYCGIDTNAEAALWMNSGGWRVVCGDFDENPDDYWTDGEFDLILSAHCFEHTRRGPENFLECWRLLTRGGSLILVLPDDSQSTLCDHFWFWTEETLRSSLAKAGFEVIKSATRQIIPQEKFLYALARKP